MRFVGANQSSPAYLPLRDLAERYFGVPTIVAEAFRDLEGLDELYIFGYWATRAADLAGPEPNDIDVLAIGRPNRDAAYAASLRVERRIGKPVNVTIRSPESWARKADGFLQHIAAGNLIPIIP